MLSGPQLKEHVLNRLGYGQSYWHDERYDELGFSAYVTEQLAGSLRATSNTGTTIEQKLARSVVSRRQLETVLLDFWFNHFNVSAFSIDPELVVKSISGRKIGDHQNVAIAPHVLGSFGDMLLATAMSPSMLDYLDNRINYKEEVVNGVAFGLNDNYAREVMELHTIGVDGGYSETDIKEAARVLTGWSVSADEFKFKFSRHDKGAKTIMGQFYPADRNMEEGEEFLAWLASRPAASQFLSRKLTAKLVNEAAPAGVVSVGSQAYISSDGDLRATIQAILFSSGFLDPVNFRAKIKPPHRFIASGLQAMGARSTSDFEDLLADLAALTVTCGEVPYVVDPPTGYPERSDFWVSGASMITRFQIAERIAYHPTLRYRLRQRAGSDGVNALTTVTQIARVLVPGGLSDESRDAVLDHVVTNASSNNGRVSAAAHLILCSPEFVRF